jgi:glycosyltransferase involved in cell wall biosynthesis
MFQSDKLVFISVSNSMGGAEQCLQLIAEEAKGQFIFLKKVDTNYLPIKSDIKARFLTKGPLVWGFMLLAGALFNYRKDYKIISSHAYLNAYMGFLKRIGYLKSAIIVRESTQIFTRFNGLKKYSYKLAYQFGYPGVQLVICQTNIMRTQLIEHNKFMNAEKVICVPNPINLMGIYNQSKQKPLNMPGNFVCAAGRLIPVKGFHLLIMAFKEIVDIHPDLKLIILGTGPQKKDLLLLIDQLSLNGKVILQGYVDNPYPYFKNAKLCVVSSIKEGFPNVLLQMLALNTAIVTTLCAGGIEDIPGINKVKTKQRSRAGKRNKNSFSGE